MENTCHCLFFIKLSADLNKPTQPVLGDCVRQASASIGPSSASVGCTDEANVMSEDRNCDLGRRAASYTCKDSGTACPRKLENEASKFNKEDQQQLPVINNSVIPVDYRPDDAHIPDLFSAKQQLLSFGQHSERTTRRPSPRHTDFQDSANRSSDNIALKSDHEPQQCPFAWSPDFFSVDM